MLDIKQVQEEAQKELIEEKSKKAKELIKIKMRELDRSKQIVVNLERELNELYANIGAGIS